MMIDRLKAGTGEGVNEARLDGDGENGETKMGSSP